MRRIDGNDNLFQLISNAADALVDLIREAETRGEFNLRDRAHKLYGETLDLRTFAQKHPSQWHTFEPGDIHPDTCVTCGKAKAWQAHKGVR